MTYIVQPGDTLFSIAARHGVSVQAIIQANRLTPPFNVFPGQRLFIPVGVPGGPGFPGGPGQQDRQLEQRVSRLEAEQRQTTQRLNRLETEVDRLRRRVDRLESGR